MQTAPNSDPSVGQLISDLERSGILLSADGDQLNVSAPKDTLTPELRETLKRRTELMQETKLKIEAQDEQIQKITAVNEEKQKDVNDRLKRVEEARKLNLFEDEKNRRLSKLNAAHKAKMQFIEEKYDYTSKAKSMSLQDFRELMESNVAVNSSLTPFTGKLEAVQKEI